MKVIFHRLAARDYLTARRWYELRSVDVADRFRRAVIVAVKRIEAAPDVSPRYEGEFRAVRIGRFPYQLWYRQRGPDIVMIVAVAHTSRRQGYWRRRKI